MAHHYAEDNDGLHDNLDGAPSLEAVQGFLRRPKQPAPWPPTESAPLEVTKMEVNDARLTNELRAAVLDVLGKGNLQVGKRGEMLLAAAAVIGEEGRRLAAGDWDAKLIEQAERLSAALESFYTETVTFVGLLNTIQVGVDLGVARSSGNPSQWIDDIANFRSTMSQIVKALRERCPDAVSRVSALAHRKD